MNKETKTIVFVGNKNCKVYLCHLLGRNRALFKITTRTTMYHLSFPKAWKSKTKFGGGSHGSQIALSDFFR